MMPRPGNEDPRLDEALQFVQSPDFVPAESQPARVAFDREGPGLHFRFPTPRPSEFVENNLVYGRLYRCARAWQERPVIVLLHGGGDSLGYRFRYPLMCRQCNRAGFNAATLVSPYHFQRRPQHAKALRWPNYLRLAEATAQAIAEIRAFTAWLLAEGCPAVALWGFSLGGRLAGFTACHQARLTSVVLAAPSVRLNLSFPETVFWRRARETLLAERPAWEALNRASFNLALSQPAISKENILLIEAAHDLFVGKEGIEELWRTWGEPEMWRLPHGHVTKAPLPGLTGRVLRWLAPRLRDGAFSNECDRQPT